MIDLLRIELPFLRIFTVSSLPLVFGVAAVARVGRGRHISRLRRCLRRGTQLEKRMVSSYFCGHGSEKNVEPLDIFSFFITFVLI